MPTDFDDDQRPPSPVEKMINALDEVREAVDRLAAENRAQGRRTGQDDAPEDPYEGT